MHSLLTDNGTTSTSKDFTLQITMFEQVIQLAGTGVHRHSAFTERNIQTIMDIARTMMLHLAIHWTDVADACSWPMAVQHALFLPDGITNRLVSLLMIFSRGVVESNGSLLICMFWGALFTVSRRGCTMERSFRIGNLKNEHCVFQRNTPVPLLNLDSVNNTFNVVFDDWFTAVAASLDSLPDLNSQAWSKLF